jgi:molybdopterin synthase sulfur carrier subunit
MRVRFFAFIRDFTGCNETDIPCEATIGDLARKLCDIYGSKMQQKVFPLNDGKFGSEIIFLINGRHVNHLGGTSAPLKPDDTVDVFPVVAGG